MYALTVSLYRSHAKEIYEELQQMYKLPTIAMLLRSIDETISWLECDKEVQAYYVDNLRESNRRHIFQMRFKANPTAHDFVSLFISIEQQRDPVVVHTLSLQFPSRGDRKCHSKIIGWLKEIARTQPHIEFEVTGFGERDTLRYISEHSLSAFQWHEDLHRYLHVTDHFHEVKEVKKGMYQ